MVLNVYAIIMTITRNFKSHWGLHTYIKQELSFKKIYDEVKENMFDMSNMRN